MKSNHYVSLFYLILNIVVYFELPLYHKSDFSHAHFIGLGKLFSSYYTPSFFQFYPYITFVLLSLACLLPHSKYLKVTATFSFILYFSLLYSFGKIGHASHTWLLTSIIVIFINTKESLLSQINSKIMVTLQMASIIPYVCSGLWKARNLDLSLNYLYYSEVLLNHVAYTVAEGNGPSQEVLTWLVNHQLLLAVSFVSVVLFQLTSFIPIITRKFVLSLGFSAVMFHLATHYILGINFKMQIAAVVFFLIFTELVMKKMKKVNA